MIKLEKATLEDVEAIYAIEQEVFSSPWSLESIRSEVLSDRAHYILLKDDDTLVGYGGYWKIFDEGHITNIAVSRPFWGQGYGHQLVAHMLGSGKNKGINRFTLEVRASNAPAIHLYKSHGFTEAGRRKGFYDDPKEDALIMWCEVSE